uniref:(northern house mosquito) hypothetical protein n=1 Tax=Culex pipiens TaxID=7175 RepID=A0A8D8IVU0_CULPI
MICLPFRQDFKTGHEPKLHGHGEKYHFQPVESLTTFYRKRFSLRVPRSSRANHYNAEATRGQKTNIPNINKFNVFHPKSGISNPKTKSKEVSLSLRRDGCERELIKNKAKILPVDEGTLFLSTHTITHTHT